MSEKTLSKRGQKGVPAGEAFGKLVEVNPFYGIKVMAEA